MHTKSKGKFRSEFMLVRIPFFKEYPPNDPVIKTLRDYEVKHGERLLPYSTGGNVEVSGVIDDDKHSGFIGPILANINRRVTPLPEALIACNRMTMDELRRNPRFAQMSVGRVSLWY